MNRARGDTLVIAHKNVHLVTLVWPAAPLAAADFTVPLNLPGSPAVQSLELRLDRNSRQVRKKPALGPIRARTRPSNRLACRARRRCCSSPRLRCGQVIFDISCMPIARSGSAEGAPRSVPQLRRSIDPAADAADAGWESGGEALDPGGATDVMWRRGTQDACGHRLCRESLKLSRCPTASQPVFLAKDGKRQSPCWFSPKRHSALPMTIVMLPPSVLHWNEKTIRATMAT